MYGDRRSVFVDREIALYNARNKPLAPPMPTHTVGMIPERAIRGFTALNSSVRMAKALGAKSGTAWTEKDCRRIFQEMDSSNDGYLDFNELEAWIIKNKIFEENNIDEQKVRIQKTFADIDKTGDGKLDLREFTRFCQLLEREQRNLAYADKHYLTSLPDSMLEANNKIWTLDYIESQLHKKIEQGTSSDKDRLRQIQYRFKTQIQRTKDGVEKPAIAITRRDFHKFLGWLGLFATQKQADALFDKYDVNGDGALSVHEFLTKGRPSDYPNSRRAHPRLFSENKGGKKMYKNDLRNGGAAPRINTPNTGVYPYSIRDIAQAIRDKMSQSGKVGLVYVDSMGRRDLAQIFRYFDKKGTGYVHLQDFVRAVEMVNVNSLGHSHVELLHDKFGKMVNGNPVLNYVPFIEFVFPDADKTPDDYLSGTTLDLREKHYRQNQNGAFKITHSGRSSARKLAPMGNRMTHSASSGNLDSGRNRTPSHGRRSLSRAASSAAFETQKTFETVGMGHHAPGRIKAVANHEQVNPLMAALPDDYYKIRSITKSSIMY
jgi:Ca2+-binding EF-hand superfamily protein